MRIARLLLPAAFLAASLFCTPLVAPALAAEQTHTENIALGRRYSFVPPPNYPHCTDDGDLVQLTDGRRTRKDKQLWIQKGGVGWKLPVDGEAEVVIDLGRVCPIGSVTITTGSAPQAEVYLPSLLIAVSDDGDQFRVIRRIDQRNARQLFRTTVRADQLRTRGRYVLVRFKLHGVFGFCDEIEVFLGAHDLQDSVLPEEILARLEVAAERTALQERLLRDLDALGQQIAGSASALPGLSNDLDTLRRQIEACPKTDGPAVSDLEGKTRRVQRRTAQALFREPRLAVWQIEPWTHISPGDVPLGGPDKLAETVVVAGQNEYESAAIMFTNLSGSPRELRVGLEGSLAAAERWGGTVKLREAVFVRTRGGGLVADALPLLREGRLKVAPWESRQLSLQIHTGQAKPGRHQGAIVVSDGTATSRRIPLQIDVLPVRIPNDLPLATYSWHYVDTWPALEGIEEAAVADLAAHYTNVNIFTNRLLAWPEVDDEGVLVGPIDFSGYDTLLDLCRPISTKGTTWFLGMRSRKTGLRKFERFSPKWNRAFGQWLRAWTKALSSRGLTYDDFFLYPYDEYARRNFVTMGKLIRSIDPKLRIFANPMLRDSDDVLREAAPYVDIWCPMLSGVVRRPEQMNLLRETGKTVWSYTVLRGKASRPYSDCRLTLWRAFKHGAKGCGFWCYAQGGSWSDDRLWDDFDDRGSDYAVIYTLNGAPPGVSRSEPIIPSKRWEAWREGVEDYVYLHLLRAQRQRYGEAVENALRRVLDAPQDVTRADRERIRLLSLLRSSQ